MLLEAPAVRLPTTKINKDHQPTENAKGTIKAPNIGIMRTPNAFPICPE
jgi:hypothetical protein